MYAQTSAGLAATQNSKYSNEPVGIERETAFGTLKNELSLIAERLSGVESRISFFRERTMGSQPTEGQKDNAPRPVPNGHLGSLEEKLDGIKLLLTRLEFVSQQIEQIG